MRQSSFLRRLCIGLILFGFLTSTAVGAPWTTLLTRNRVSADPNKSYRLTTANGPWTILACSFSGEMAEKEAHELVLELRKRYRLSAYVYQKSFDLGDETIGLGVNKYGDPRRMQYQRRSKFDEVAVMVGNYASIDEPAAQSTLKKLKYFRPKSLEIRADSSTNRTLAGWRTIQQKILAYGNDKKKKGPMSHAFLTRNPLLPEEYFNPLGLDPFVLKLNEGVPYSLLDCPGKFTVQVACFTGKVVIDDQKIRRINETGKMESELAAAAAKATKVVNALRRSRREAYVFHDRSASIVTVGSFDSAGTPRSDGRIEINPRIHALIETFKARPLPMGYVPSGHLNAQPVAVAGIPLDVQPIAVEVPKRSIRAAMARTNSPRR